MKSILKKSLALILALTMVFGAAPLAFAGGDLILYREGIFEYEVDPWGIQNDDGSYSPSSKIWYCNKNASGKVTIPATLGGYPVDWISSYAFNSCNDITGFMVDMNNSYYSNDDLGILYNSDGTEIIRCPIGTELTDFTISDSVTSIGTNAFNNCAGLTSVTILDSVTSVGCDAFVGTSIYNNSSKWENNVLYIGNHLIKAESYLSGSFSIKSGTKTIAGGAFSDCDSLKSVTIPDSVTSIGKYAFRSCTGLSSIIIGNGVTSIGEYAFDGCCSLTNVTITDGVTSIDNWAFRNCTKLTSVTIGNRVTSIGKEAFYNCKNLKSVTIADSVTSIDYGAFVNCNSLTDVYYTGSEADWNKISINRYNAPLINANIHFNYVPGAHEHSFTSSVTKGATCTEAGEKTYSCECEYSYTEVIPAKGHTPGAWKVIEEPTTQKEGKKVRKCSECGAEVEQALIPKLIEEPVVEVIKNPSTSSIAYGDSIVLHVDPSKIPEGGYVEWTASNGNFDMSVSADGTTCKISPKSSGKTVFTATVYDKNGNAISTDTQEMTAKAGFFDKIVAFFKKIFGLTKTIPEAFKSVVLINIEEYT